MMNLVYDVASRYRSSAGTTQHVDFLLQHLKNKTIATKAQLEGLILDRYTMRLATWLSSLLYFESRLRLCLVLLHMFILFFLSLSAAALAYLKKNVNDLSGFDSAAGVGVSVTREQIHAEVSKIVV